MRAAWADRLDAWLHDFRGNRWRWLIAALLLLVSALVYWRGPISERLLPDPRMNRQLELAQQALAKGKLSVADGTGARELFESVLAADPDQMAARQGLVEVRDAAIARAQQALAQHRLLQARNNLALAESLSAPAVQLQPLKARLRDLEEASGDVSAMLATAAVPGVTDEAALALFDRVLQLDAENAAALDGRGALLARWLAQAEALLAANKVRDAQRLVEKVIAADPGHVDLPPVQAKLGEAMARLQREQAHVLELAQADERAGRIDSAADRYLQFGTGCTGWPCLWPCRRNGRRPISSSGAPPRRWRRPVTGARRRPKSPLPSSASRNRDRRSNACSASRRVENVKSCRNCWPKPDRRSHAANSSRRRAPAPGTNCAWPARSRRNRPRC